MSTQPSPLPDATATRRGAVPATSGTVGQALEYDGSGNLIAATIVTPAAFALLTARVAALESVSTIGLLQWGAAILHNTVGFDYTLLPGYYGSDDANMYVPSMSIPFACRVRNFRVHVADPNLSGTTYTFRFWVNGAATSIVCAIDDGLNDGSDLVHSELLAPGDLIRASDRPSALTTNPLSRVLVTLEMYRP